MLSLLDNYTERSEVTSPPEHSLCEACGRAFCALEVTCRWDRGPPESDELAWPTKRRALDTPETEEQKVSILVD